MTDRLFPLTRRDTLRAGAVLAAGITLPFHSTFAATATQAQTGEKHHGLC